MPGSSPRIKCLLLQTTETISPSNFSVDLRQPRRGSGSICLDKIKENMNTIMMTTASLMLMVNPIVRVISHD